jgi:hypothetical protein
MYVFQSLPKRMSDRQWHWRRTPAQPSVARDRIGNRADFADQSSGQLIRSNGHGQLSPPARCGFAGIGDAGA